MPPDWQMIPQKNPKHSTAQEVAPLHPLEPLRPLMPPDSSHAELGLQHFLSGPSKSSSAGLFNGGVLLPPIQSPETALKRESISDSVQQLAVAAIRRESVPMTATLSSASNSTLGPGDVDRCAMSPSKSSLALSSKHHHPNLPVRSPARSGQGILMTSTATASSTTDTPPTGFINMDFYSMYHGHPENLHPEWDRPRRPSADLTQTGIATSSRPLPVYTQDQKKSRGKSSGRVSATTAGKSGARISGSDELGHFRPARKQSFSLISSVSSHADLAQEASGSSAYAEYPSEQDAVLSKTALQDIKTPTKRKRTSKKEAAEMEGANDGSEMPKKKKRTKKLDNTERASSTSSEGGHGGQRTAYEVRAVPVLAPDVGPISMLEGVSLPLVIWKGTPLNITNEPGYGTLHSHEAHMASTLRLTPAVYLSCKETLILASRTHARKSGKLFRKSDAQKLCPIDVNKTSKLWEAFARIGWLDNIPTNI
ncbi:hypothetical protein BGX28_008337 [Mortierella sp. GBA30]|nr:hypothetical protein BGX28_008337 [Mortierella sp. GBA30]